ncbi:Protein of unknown function [Gryllus bimaculatus]|nr:Protein of unknown function [Gryllus bimaculatus]
MAAVFPLKSDSASLGARVRGASGRLFGAQPRANGEFGFHTARECHAWELGLRNGAAQAGAEHAGGRVAKQAFLNLTFFWRGAGGAHGTENDDAAE